MSMSLETTLNALKRVPTKRHHSTGAVILEANFEKLEADFSLSLNVNVINNMLMSMRRVMLFHVMRR